MKSFPQALPTPRASWLGAGPSSLHPTPGCAGRGSSREETELSESPGTPRVARLCRGRCEQLPVSAPCPRPPQGSGWPWTGCGPLSAPPRSAPSRRPRRAQLLVTRACLPEGALSLHVQARRCFPLPRCRGAPAPQAGVSYLESMALAASTWNRKDTKALGTRLPRGNSGPITSADI